MVCGDLQVNGIKCNKLTAKYEQLYSSYHVEVKVITMDLKSAIELLMSPESWPVGVFVKRYFKQMMASHCVHLTVVQLKVL